MDRSPWNHIPVLAGSVIELLRPIETGLVLDATFGGGGHTRLLLESMPDVRILAMDRDPRAEARAAALGERVSFRLGDFRTLGEVLDERGEPALAGALFDLGLSSLQLDDPGRGFSYHQPGPLDMRMGPDAPTTADAVVNELTAAELASILRRFGEERFAQRIARGIVAARPIGDTAHLAAVVADAVPAASRRRGHPARRAFQAIRIAVNGELEALPVALDAAIARLRPGGRIVVISYHSLEDRIVKRRFRSGAGQDEVDPRLPAPPPDPELRLLTRRPIRPDETEVSANRRARSAVLRAAEKLDPERA